VEISDVGIIKCNYELHVKVNNKSDIQFKTLSTVIPPREYILFKLWLCRRVTVRENILNCMLARTRRILSSFDLFVSQILI
jgi:hypothetical protein